MDKLTRLGQFLFGLAITAIGCQNLVCGWLRVFSTTTFPGENVTSVIPWVPAIPWLAWVTGMVLLVTGTKLILNLQTRVTAIFLGALFLLFVIFLEAPRTIASHFELRTITFETLAISGSALMLAESLSSGHSANPALRYLVHSGRYFFGISCLVFGIDHLMVLSFIASLEPYWMPFKMFWALFTGLGFIVTGICVMTKWLGRLSSTWLGIMFLIWILVLHLPRTLGFSAAGGGPHAPEEWSSTFIALAMCGGSWICAQLLSPKPLQKAEPIPIAAE
jgi:uncharacterized membrane protein YphA (DoxX/SURF4 family)